MQVQDHVLALHLLKNRVEGLVADDTGAAVCGYAGGVGLDARDTCGCGLLDHFGGDVLVQVQRHQEVDIGLNCLESLLVVQSVLNSGDWRYQVGLW